MSTQKRGHYGDLSYMTFSQSWPDHTAIWQWRPTVRGCWLNSWRRGKVGRERPRQRCESLSVRLLGQARCSELTHVRQPR